MGVYGFCVKGPQDLLWISATSIANGKKGRRRTQSLVSKPDGASKRPTVADTSPA